MQPQWEVADVLRQVHIEAGDFTIQQKKVLRAISTCRTSALGGHVDACDTCGNISISYNSCRDRHCPKCQGHKREAWIAARQSELLPCTYFHVVFTLPGELNPLALYRPWLVYKSLFDAAWQTLNQFGNGEGLQLGMISILHTWGQNLSLHPHLHCVVPGGGVDANGRWQKKKRHKNFLFDVGSLSKVFRAKYLQCLRAGGIADQRLFDQLFNKDWVVYAKRPFGGPSQVIEYLGRYTHKVAISNHRIKEVTSEQVTFSYKDYNTGGSSKLMQLTNTEFLRRFAQHILPFRFVRIRHYGILSSTWKRSRLLMLQTSLSKKPPAPAPVKTMLRKCPCCKTGTLITIEIFGKRGPPQEFLIATKPAPVT